MRIGTAWTRCCFCIPDVVVSLHGHAWHKYDTAVLHKAAFVFRAGSVYVKQQHVQQQSTHNGVPRITGVRRMMVVMSVNGMRWNPPVGSASRCNSCGDETP